MRANPPPPPIVSRSLADGFCRGSLTGIDWVIVGGESGPHARPMQTQWAIEVRNQCLKAKVAFFFKQWGGRSPKSGGRLLEGREWNQFPATLAASARQLELLARA